MKRNIIFIIGSLCLCLIFYKLWRFNTEREIVYSGGNLKEFSTGIESKLVSLPKGFTRTHEVLKSIMSQTGCAFFYYGHEVPPFIEISRKLENITLQKALEEIFKDYNVTWKYYGEDIRLEKQY